MNCKWYALIPRSAVSRLSPLRGSHRVEVLSERDRLWLRGPRLDQETHDALRAVLGCRTYRPLEDGQLVPIGKSLPAGREPNGQWTPLHQWLTAILPKRRFAMRSVSRAKLRLVRSVRDEAPGLICVSRETWLSYAATAPRARLDRLVFATSRRQTAILGQPLPPLRGTYFWLREGIGAPVGLTWVPAVDPLVLRDSFGLDQDDVALFMPQGGYTIIRSDQFVGASRSAARLTEGVGGVGS